jgi:competence protein ComEC
MRKSNLPTGLKVIALITAMAFGLLSVQAGAPRMAPPERPARIHYINVGQADSILLEFDKVAVMIDAGGESTSIPEEQTHLVTYLEKFFQNRPDLNRTIHTIIISHPHIDHTMKLPDIVQKFTVKNLIDGGDDKGSGIGPLQKSREFVSSHGGSHFAISDTDVNGAGFENAALKSIHDVDQSVDIKLLSGSRGCANANNSSLVVLVTYKTARFIFTGDAEDIGADDCSDEIGELIDRYKENGELKANVLKVNHHGSANGSDAEWLGAIKPSISVISAGRVDKPHQGPGQFHAFQFGHPRESAVAIIESGTSGTRTPAATVTTMDAVRRPRTNRQMQRAVYCTCWDGNIVIETTPDGRILPPKTNQ